MLKPVRFIPRGARVPVLRARVFCFVLSAVLVLGSFVALATAGLNFGIDFKGGILMEVRTPGPADISGLRNTLNGLGVGEVSLQEFGADRELLIRIQRQTGDEAAPIKEIGRGSGRERG